VRQGGVPTPLTESKPHSLPRNRGGSRPCSPRRLLAITIFVVALPALASPAFADLQLCNRTSYVVEAAIGIEDKGTAATRGWFRVDPGQCRAVMQGKVEAERVFVHARALPVYGASPMARAGHADLCIAEGAFLVPGARHCTKPGQRLVRFTEVKPSETDQGSTANLAEEADYTAEQARLAGIQRLLTLAGYDASPVDGIEGRKTEAALAQFLKDRRLTSEAAAAPGFFDTLAGALKQADGIGFAWCNDTAHTVMAAFGIEEKGAVVTRGWYRIEASKCLKPDVAGKPRRLYSFAEAVDPHGQAVRRANKPLSWGGSTQLCTRNVKFEISDHKECIGKGLTPAGFAAIDLAGRSGATVRFRE
jgi:uncharacterized membrane protein